MVSGLNLGDAFYVLGTVFVGTFFGTIFYLQYLLSGIDVGAVFRNTRSITSLTRWAMVNVLIGLVIAMPCLKYITAFSPLIPIFLFSVINAATPYVERHFKHYPLGQTDSGNISRFFYYWILEEFLKIQKWAIQPFLNERDAIISEKDREVMNIAKDLIHIFGEKSLVKVINLLSAESSSIHPSIKQSLMGEDNKYGQLLILIKTYNLDIIHLILNTDKRLNKEIGDRYKILVAHQRNRKVFDSVQHAIFHFSGNDIAIQHLNQEAKRFIEGANGKTYDWGLIGKTCNELFSIPECENCCIRQGLPKNEELIDLPCKFGKCRIHPLMNDSGFILVKAL